MLKTLHCFYSQMHPNAATVRNYPKTNYLSKTCHLDFYAFTMFHLNKFSCSSYRQLSRRWELNKHVVGQLLESHPPELSTMQP